jgi:hypothetical protein
VNIGMTIGIMPITGLPSPFVSYGGSAVFADMIAIGLLQSVPAAARCSIDALGRTSPGPIVHVLPTQAPSNRSSIYS